MQLRREKRILRWGLGQWGYWRRWQFPKEAARDIPEEEDRVQRAVRHVQRFNEAAPSEKMRIVECAHVWGVSSVDLRAELNYLLELQAETDSDYDDIMQQ